MGKLDWKSLDTRRAYVVKKSIHMGRLRSRVRNAFTLSVTELCLQWCASHKKLMFYYRFVFFFSIYKSIVNATSASRDASIIYVRYLAKFCSTLAELLATKYSATCVDTSGLITLYSWNGIFTKHLKIKNDYFQNEMRSE